MLISVSGLTSIWGYCEIKRAMDIIVIVVEVDPLSVGMKALSDMFELEHAERMLMCFARQERTENSLVLILASERLKTTCKRQQNPIKFTCFDSSQWRTLSHL